MGTLRLRLSVTNVKWSEPSRKPLRVGHDRVLGGCVAYVGQQTTAAGRGHLNTTVRAAGLPSARAVASCMYLAYGRLLFCVSDRCNNDLQGALLTICCVVIVCKG